MDKIKKNRDTKKTYRILKRQGTANQPSFLKSTFTYNIGQCNYQWRFFASVKFFVKIYFYTYYT